MYTPPYSLPVATARGVSPAAMSAYTPGEYLPVHPARYSMPGMDSRTYSPGEYTLPEGSAREGPLMPEVHREKSKRGCHQHCSWGLPYFDPGCHDYCEVKFKATPKPMAAAPAMPTMTAAPAMPTMAAMALAMPTMTAAPAMAAMAPAMPTMTAMAAAPAMAAMAAAPAMASAAETVMKMPDVLKVSAGESLSVEIPNAEDLPNLPLAAAPALPPLDDEGYCRRRYYGGCYGSPWRYGAGGCGCGY